MILNVCLWILPHFHAAAKYRAPGPQHCRCLPSGPYRREVYTGTACQGRRELDKLLRIVQEGDTIVFDSVSRMSRSAEEGCALYETLYKRGVNLVPF